MSETTKPCPECGTPGTVLQLDSGHWEGYCAACGYEGVMHWSKGKARKLWNAIRRPSHD